MMMASIGWRDLLMVMLGVGALPIALYDAYLGLLAYAVFSFIRPAQSLTWASDVATARFTFFVGIVLIFRSLMTPSPRFRLRAPSVVFLAFWAWMVVCTVFSTHRAESMEFLEKFSKIGIVALLLTGLVHQRWQLKWLVIVLALCPGFYAAKLGWYFLSGQAQYTHHGGPEGLDSNDIALFIAMGFPLLIFGAAEIRRTWLRWGMVVLAFMCIPAVIVGESRGGMLALAASILITVWRRVGWLRTVAILAILAPIAFMMVPAETMARYKTLGDDPSADISAQGRLWAWQVSREMAKANPVVGIGMSQKTYIAEYPQYQIEPLDWPHVAHSVWFSALAGMGYPGLVLFVLLILATLWTTRRVRHMARDALGDEGGWAVSYATGVETAVIAFAIAGSFLSQVGFEFIYAIMMLSVPLLALLQEEVARREAGDVITPPVLAPTGVGRLAHI